MNLAWIGTGTMGAAMAAHLVRAGHDVAVWNRTLARTDELATLGARVATSPADAATVQGDLVVERGGEIRWHLHATDATHLWCTWTRRPVCADGTRVWRR